MKYLEVIEKIRRDNTIHFEATRFGYLLQLWGDESGCYVFDVQCLVDIGTPWFVFDLDWKEVQT